LLFCEGSLDSLSALSNQEHHNENNEVGDRDNGLQHEDNSSRDSNADKGLYHDDFQIADCLMIRESNCYFVKDH
jgi:hypothetical protein